MSKGFELYHSGTPHDGLIPHSGRYQYGSGEKPFQHEESFRGYVARQKNKGYSESDIAKVNHMTTSELRNRISAEKMNERNTLYYKAIKLQNQGLGPTEIAKELGMKNESSVRSLLDPVAHERNQIAMSTANMLKEEIDKYGSTDVGAGMEARLGITRTKMDFALALLEEQGYVSWNVPVKQLGTGKTTNVKTMNPPGTKWVDVVQNKDKIHIINDPYTEDGGKTWSNWEFPKSVDSKRVTVRYSEEGGKDQDGIIEIRRGVKDLDLGGSNYAQVRIAVDGTHFLKGVARYSDDIPDGYDILVNSSKAKGKPSKMDYFKLMKGLDKDKDGNIIGTPDKDNPFGASLKENDYSEDGVLIKEHGQKHYIGDDGKKHLSPINFVNEEGDWQKWSKNLPTQMLSKQSPALAEKQLNLAYEKRLREFNEIKALTNTAVQQKMLESFIDDCDAASVSMKAAALPGQCTHLLMPVPSMPEGEIYAPNYPDGTIVSLIRFPHEGTFQIPTLRVNNKYQEARRLLGSSPRDLVGVNQITAEKLSGADFDGDTVIVIPNPNGKLISSRPMLEKLRDFDDKAEYPAYPGMTKVGAKTDGFRKQQQMGTVSNLIMDMTILGATDDEFARAVKYSMTVIDAEKHNLNWKQCYKDQNIAELYAKYSSSKNGGGVTLITRAKSRKDIPERKQVYDSKIDKETGKYEYEPTGKTHMKKNPETGEYDIEVPNMERITKLEYAHIYGNGARDLSTGTLIEEKYVDYSDRMYALANEARKYKVSLDNMPYHSSAKEKYKDEVQSINDKMVLALANKPLERKAQLLANQIVSEKRRENPDLDYEDLKKLSGQTLAAARNRMGASKYRFSLTNKEWEAIQAGAITHSKMSELLNYLDIEKVREMAMPKDYAPKLSSSEIAYAKRLLNTGNYTSQQIAEYLGVSTSTLYRAIDK